jgi:ATP-dependent RNA helicase DDX10/DBP4
VQFVNIVIATPGRLLQHFQDSFGFNGDNVQVLVVDEADMIFEMGFLNTLTHILE